MGVAAASTHPSLASLRIPLALNRSLLTPAPPATDAPTPAPTPGPEIRPTRIGLPTLGVDAPIVAVGIDEDGAMGTPGTADEVAWWDGMPVGAGNALFAGHKDWNHRQGSFFRIADLKPGDAIRLDGEGGSLEFHVEWVRQLGGDEEAVQDILGDAGKPVVTLITCGGEFDRRIRHYKDRVVVRAVLA